MRTGRTTARLLVGGLVLGGLLLGGQPDAKAECVHLELYVRRANTGPMWVHGEHDPCVVPTYWNQTVLITHGDNNTINGQPEGTPSGYHVDLRVPLP